MAAALIPAVTVPISLIASFTVLMALGLSINMLTLNAPAAHAVLEREPTILIDEAAKMDVQNYEKLFRAPPAVMPMAAPPPNPPIYQAPAVPILPDAPIIPAVPILPDAPIIPAAPIAPIAPIAPAAP